MARKLYYKIGEACKSLDIQPYVLRYWETEFAALRPNKSKSGQRVYSEEDLVVIRRIKELLYDEGYTIAGAKKKLAGEDLSSLTAESAEDGEEETETGADAGEKEVEEASEDEAEEAEDEEREAVAEAAEKSEPAAAKKPSAAEGLLPEVRAGLEKALEETRAILALLDKSGSSR